MMHLTLNVVAQTLFATDLREEVDELADAINRIMGLYNFLVMLPAAEWLVHVRPPGLAAFVRARKRIDAVVYRMIAAHRQFGARDGSLLDLMLAASPDKSAASEQSLRDQVITIFLAGYETVANALSWTWYLLSQNPDCERRFHDEIDRELQGRSATFDDVPRLRYVEMVLAESLRLFPPAWAMGRYARADFRLGEYVLPAKTTVLISQFITHRDPRFFPDPLRFDPERFTPEAKARRSKLTYFPFGAGVRQCIGESFAWMEGVLLLATIAQKWRLKLVAGHPVEPEPLITLRPKHGMPCTWNGANPRCSYLSAKYSLRHMLRDFSWLRVRQIRECDHSQLIVDITIDSRFKSLPRAVVVNAAVSGPIVNEPAKTVVAFVLLPILQTYGRPHQVKARPLQKFFRVQGGVPLLQIENREVKAAVGGRVHHGRHPLLILQFALHQPVAG